MKILVTGGAGLVGSHVAEFYANNGDTVIVLDNLMRSELFGYSKESVEYNWNYLSKFENITRIKGDVRNKEDVEKALGDGVDVVVHAAGQPGVPLSVKIPIEDFTINAFGTLNVLECTRQICPKATVIYTSTNKVYGENVEKIPLKELDTRYIFDQVEGVHEELGIDLTGHTPYGVSKYTGDIYMQEYAHIYGMKTGVFRMSCIYGDRQFGFEDQGWVAWFIIAALYDRPITIFGDGKQVRDVLYVKDLVNAFNAFIQSDLTSGVFNTGGGPENTISLLEFMNTLEKITGKKVSYKLADWRPSDQKVYISDTKKIQKTLSWKPQVPIEEGIQKIVDWIKQNEEFFK